MLHVSCNERIYIYLSACPPPGNGITSHNDSDLRWTSPSNISGFCVHVRNLPSGYMMYPNVKYILCYTNVRISDNQIITSMQPMNLHDLHDTITPQDLQKDPSNKKHTKKYQKNILQPTLPPHHPMCFNQSYLQQCDQYMDHSTRPRRQDHQDQNLPGAPSPPGFDPWISSRISGTTTCPVSMEVSN